MFNKKRLSLILVGVMGLSILLTGCGKAGNEETNKTAGGTEVEVETETNEKSQEEILDLADWNGTWNNITPYLDEEEVQVAYEELADRENTTKEEAKENFKEKVSTDFTTMEIDGDEITYLDGLKDEGGKEIEKVKYEYKGEHVMEHGGEELAWYEFKAIEEADHDVILLIDIHGEETMPHFHFRYGDDAEELMNMEDWYPTLIKPTTTLDQVYEEIAD